MRYIDTRHGVLRLGAGEFHMKRPDSLAATLVHIAELTQFCLCVGTGAHLGTIPNVPPKRQTDGEGSESEEYPRERCHVWLRRIRQVVYRMIRIAAAPSAQ
jgi:hypothetical protein